MQFLLGLFVGTFMGMVIIGLCRSMAMGPIEVECSESFVIESPCINNSQVEVSLPLN